MKSLFMVLLLLPTFAHSYTQIVYNRSNNPYIPKAGIVTKQKICVDYAKDALRYVTSATTEETCQSVRIDRTDSAYPKRVCVGRRTVSVPGTVKYVPRFTQKDVCAKWDYTDSSRPRCVKSAAATVEQATSYTQYTYEAADYRRERPVDVQEKQLESCK